MAAVVLALPLAAYLIGVVVARRRRSWPAYRTVLWCLGLAAVGAGALGPLADGDFVAHVGAHLLLGMLAPLLLVLGAPLTLALRALPVRQARLLARLLRARLVRLLTHPVTAGMLAVGGMWLTYRTDLYELSAEHEWLHWAVHVHVLVSGYLFVASMVGRDPAPHRPAHPYRAAILLLYLAAHAILAKSLYAVPPAGIPLAEGERGAVLLYYGADAIDLALLTLFCHQWLLRRRPPREHPTPDALPLTALGAVAQPVRAVDS
jgi:putative membrane protein